jgi:CRP/FNR family transcriptional regulator, cyclic AMP receptor protein
MERTTLLANIQLFESLSPEDLTALAQRLEERVFESGAEVFKQGDADTASLFIIEEGSIDISILAGKNKISLASLFTGQYFGELSLLDGTPRSATATAQKKSILLALDRDDFVDFIKRRPDASLRILSELAERIRHTNELMTHQVSKNVAEEADEKATFGQRIADRVASFGGSWGFIGVFTLFMVIWMALNSIESIAWDPYAFTLLNLMLSTTAALQAPVIMMSQNRQSIKEKLFAVNDFQVNLKNEIGIDRLLRGQAELLQRVMLLERYISSGGLSNPKMTAVKAEDEKPTPQT